MHELRQVLVHVNDSPRSAAVVRFAAEVAKAHGAALAAVQAVEPIPTGAYLTPEASTIAARLSEEAAQARGLQARQCVADAAAAAGIEIPLEVLDGDPLPALLLRAHAADLLVLGQRDPGTRDGLPPGFDSALVVGAGCPLLFVPFAGEPAGCGRRVLVAWSPQRESARALRDALPLLRRAEAVELMHFAGEADAAAAAQPLEPVLAHLKRHGIAARATVRQVREPSIGERMLRSAWTPDTTVAETLLSHAADMDADLLVSGGYGHSRAWELALGGVTRTLLRTMTVPVLMSH
jgi:nucleotide-binding universal stress UspA family protein